MTSSKSSWLAAVGWLIISTFLLTIPGSSFPKENWLDRLWVDKWVHIFIFSLMTWLWCRVTNREDRNNSQREKIFVGIALVVLAYGIGMEYVQKYCVANRGFDAWDILADAVGVALGYGYSRRRYIKK